MNYENDKILNVNNKTGIARSLLHFYLFTIIFTLNERNLWQNALPNKNPFFINVLNDIIGRKYLNNVDFVNAKIHQKMTTEALQFCLN